MSKYGKFRGRLVHNGSKFAQLRQRQLGIASDEGAALRAARPLVTAKIQNQRVVLQRRAERVPHVQRALKGMMRMSRRAERARTLNELRGFEGKAGAFYFAAIRALLPPAWGFEKRAYHPPPDPANSLLSFGYTLLLKDMTAAVHIVGLDPYLGFFHALGRDRPALVLDLIEEFRPVIVDSMVLDIVARKQLVPGDFKRSRNPRRPCQLGEAGVQIVLKRYEERLQTSLHHPLAGGETTYRRAFELQARQMARVVRGKDGAYHPLRIR
jgi:CRISPR-associated protein Cas1